jgi:hypothetical protein
MLREHPFFARLVKNGDADSALIFVLRDVGGKRRVVVTERTDY